MTLYLTTDSIDMAAKTERERRVLFWFNHDLRLDDNPALAVAARSADSLLCLYCDDAARFEADRFGSPRQGAHRTAFLDASLAALTQALAASGQRLLRRRGDPVQIIAQLVRQLDIGAVVRSRHFGFYERQQWQALQRCCAGTEFIEIDSYTLFDAAQLMPRDEFPQTFSRFRRYAEKLAVAPALSRVSLPPPLEPAGPDDDAGVSKEGLEPIFDGGEAAARCHLERYFTSVAPSTYKQTRNQLDGWSSSSKFSPWLAAGCVSARRIYAEIREYEERRGANESTYWLFFELLWREFFQWYAQVHGARLFGLRGLNDAPPDTGFNAGRFETWCRGETAWPLVNACMRELNQTGYLSNRGRQIAASALIHDLGIDWRAGAGYFEKQLIDYDVASNWGNWQYIAGVGADARGGRHFNIAKQTRQFDPESSYVDRWTRAAEALTAPTA